MTKLIAICGIDGSGKITQIKLLEKHLMGMGFRVKRVWFRWPALISYPILALCRLLGYTRWRTIDKSGIKYAERRFYMNRTLARLWPIVFTLDTFIYLLIHVEVPRVLGHVVLCDRFIPDLLVDLMFETRGYSLLGHLAGKLLLSLIPADSKLVIVDLSEDVAYRRKHDIPSISYLKERRKLYLELSRTLRIPAIDGEKMADQVRECILKIVQHGDPVVLKGVTA